MRMDIPKVVDSVTADETVVRVIESCILEWWVSCHHCEQDHAESEKVGDLAAVWNVHDDLWSHVALGTGKVFSLEGREAKLVSTLTYEKMPGLGKKGQGSVCPPLSSSQHANKQACSVPVQDSSRTAGQ